MGQSSDCYLRNTGDSLWTADIYVCTHFLLRPYGYCELEKQRYLQYALADRPDCTDKAEEIQPNETMHRDLFTRYVVIRIPLGSEGCRGLPIENTKSKSVSYAN